MPRPVQTGAFSIDLPPLRTLRKRAERVRAKAEREALLAKIDDVIGHVERLSTRPVHKRV